MKFSTVIALASLLTSSAIALQKPYSVERDEWHDDYEPHIYRLSTIAHNDLIKSIEGSPQVETIYDLVQESVARFGDKPALGSRTLVKVHEEEKNVTKVINGVEQQVTKMWTYSELSPYSFRSYRRFGDDLANVGTGLRKLGVNPGDKVGIYAETSAEWQIFAQGCVSQSMTIVTAYAALGQEGLIHSLNQTGAVAVFTDAPLLPKLKKAILFLPNLKQIIYNGTPDQKTLQSFGNMSVISFEKLIDLGWTNPIDHVRPYPNSTACIMYTSGSTGRPKGVVLTHENVVAAVSGVDNLMKSDETGKLTITSDDRFMCFLPLAHILEFVYELYAIHIGATLGYGNPRTLTADSVRNCQGDLQEFKPTVLAGVPAVWEKVKKKIDSQIAEKNFLVRGLFWGTYKLKSKLMEWGWKTGWLNFVFKKVRAATGGDVRFCISGGAPLAVETQKFLTITHAPLLTGYGLTESSAMASLASIETLEYGTVGVPTTSVEIKLVDIPDMGYFNNNSNPQGEIWLRGPVIAHGYYDNPNETAKAFVEKGWFKTGDVGEFETSGTLKIIDRIKNLVKTLNGEYIALEKLESAYRTSKFVDNVCVYASASKAKPIAIVMPDEKTLSKEIEKKDIVDPDTVLNELTKNKAVVGLVLDDMLAAGKKAGLQGIELVAGIVLSDEKWTPENGLVTAVLKLSRPTIQKAHQKEIDELLATTE